MNNTLLKSLLALVPVSMLWAGSLILFSRARTRWSLLQLLGGSFLLVVVLTHVAEGLHVLGWAGWGENGSIGHYLDLCTAIFSVTLFPIGYLFHALEKQND